MEWISVKDRLPPQYCCRFLRYKYANGNGGRAIGFISGNEWEIEWSDDHPLDRDITKWLDEGEIQ